MEMHQVRYFLALTRELNFTRAASACNVTQPSLTRAIKLLEFEFGGALFHRDRQAPKLTELGRTVLPYLEQIWDQAHSVRLAAQDITAPSKMRLKVGVMCTLAPTNLIGLLTAVQERHPHIELEIVDSPAASLQDMLCDGLVEVIISCQPSGRSDPRLKYLRLFKEELCVILPPSHPLAAQSQIGLLDLKGEKFVQRTQCEHDCSIDGFFDELGSDFQTVYRSDRDDWILAMVSGGLGFGLLGRNSIGAALVAAKPLASPSLFRIVNLVTVRGRPHSAAVGALLHEAMRTPWSGETALSVQTLAQADPSFGDVAVGLAAQ
jgi:DNA-binding transcriptional LysR family regulator